MARGFQSADTDALVSSTLSFGSSVPFSISAWFKPANGTHTGCIFSLGRTNTSFHFLALNYIATTNVVTYENQGGSYYSISTTNAFTVGAWNHVLVAVDSATQTVTLNGDVANRGERIAATQAITTADRQHIGLFQNGGTNISKVNGEIAEIAVWEANIDEKDGPLDSLYSGHSPLIHKPAALVAYYPLLGNNSPETDLIGANDMAYVNTPTKAVHPRIVYPRSPAYRRAGSGAAAGSTARSFSVVIA